jgi:hypothetical protein
MGVIGVAVVPAADEQPQTGTKQDDPKKRMNCQPKDDGSDNNNCENHNIP